MEALKIDIKPKQLDQKHIDLTGVDIEEMEKPGIPFKDRMCIGKQIKEGVFEGRPYKSFLVTLDITGCKPPPEISVNPETYDKCSKYGFVSIRAIYTNTKAGNLNWKEVGLRFA
jgi:hypothetical protein